MILIFLTMIMITKMINHDNDKDGEDNFGEN